MVMCARHRLQLKLLTCRSYQLVRHPAALERLREEVISFTKNGTKLTRSDIAKMNYLKCVLNESERSVSPQMSKGCLTEV